MATKTLAAQYREAQAANLVPTILKTIKTVKRATGAVVILAMGTTYAHAAHFYAELGGGAFSWIIPGIFDVMIYLCLKVTQTPGLTADAKRAALKGLIGFTAVSMAVNALAPGHVMLRVIFGLVVASIAVAEWISTKIQPDFDAIEAIETANPAPLTPAQKAAKTRAANKAKAERELRRMTKGYVPKSAPVSPAPQGA